MASHYIPSNKVTAGQFLTANSNGTTTTAWASPNTNFTNSNGTAVMYMPANEDKVIVAEKAALEVKGKMVLNGIDMEERLKTIEKVLMIPERDVILEAKYPSLKKKYDEYINLLGKYRTFESIKGEDI